MSEKNLLNTVGENIFSGRTGVQTAVPFIDVEAMSAENKERMLQLGVDPEWVDTLEGMNWETINPFAWGAGKLAEQGIKKVVSGGKKLWNIYKGNENLLPKRQPVLDPMGRPALDPMGRPLYEDMQPKLTDPYQLTESNLSAWDDGTNIDLEAARKLNIPIRQIQKAYESKSIFPPIKTTKTTSEGFTSTRFLQGDEIRKVADGLDDVSLEKILNDPRSEEYFQNSDFVNRLFDRRYKPNISPQLVDDAKSTLSNELLTDESYQKWVKMRKKAHIMKMNNQGKSGFSQNLKKPDISREFYNTEVKKMIDNTPIYRIPDDEFKLLNPKEDETVRGLFNPQTGHINIKQSMNLSSIRGKTILVHELKHAVQSAFRDDIVGPWDLQKAFLDDFKNLSWFPEETIANPGSQMDKFGVYNLDPLEVSARASELRTGLKEGTDAYEQILSEVGSAFPKDVTKRLLDNIWGVAPLPILSDTERIKKVFSEEEE